MQVTWLTVVYGPVSFLMIAAWITIGVALLAGNAILFDTFVRGHARRWPVNASVAVLGFESIVCFFLGSEEWTEQWTEGTRAVVGTVGIYSVHGRFAIELFAIGALNLLASIVFFLGRWRWGWWVLIGMQVGVLVLAEIEAQLIDPDSPGWSAFSALPLLTLFLLFAFRIAQARLKPPPLSAIE